MMKVLISISALLWFVSGSVANAQSVPPLPQAHPEARPGDGLMGVGLASSAFIQKKLRGAPEPTLLFNLPEGEVKAMGITYENFSVPRSELTKKFEAAFRELDLKGNEHFAVEFTVEPFKLDNMWRTFVGSTKELYRYSEIGAAEHHVERLNISKNDPHFFIELSSNFDEAAAQVQKVIMEGGHVQGIYRASSQTLAQLERSGKFGKSMTAIALPAILFKLSSWGVDYSRRYR